MYIYILHCRLLETYGNLGAKKILLDQVQTF